MTIVNNLDSDVLITFVNKSLVMSVKSFSKPKLISVIIRRKTNNAILVKKIQFYIRNVKATNVDYGVVKLGTVNNNIRLITTMNTQNT